MGEREENYTPSPIALFKTSCRCAIQTAEKQNSAKRAGILQRCSLLMRLWSHPVDAAYKNETCYNIDRRPERPRELEGFDGIENHSNGSECPHPKTALFLVGADGKENGEKADNPVENLKVHVRVSRECPEEHSGGNEARNVQGTGPFLVGEVVSHGKTVSSPDFRVHDDDLPKLLSQCFMQFGRAVP